MRPSSMNADSHWFRTAFTKRSVEPVSHICDALVIVRSPAYCPFSRPGQSTYTSCEPSFTPCLQIPNTSLRTLSDVSSTQAFSSNGWLRAVAVTVMSSSSSGKISSVYLNAL